MNEPWLERWQEGRIGWHEADGNRSLQKHWQAQGKRVLVPLCGKTVDLLWLEAQGNEVVGVELADLAARAFFTENELAFDYDAERRAYSARDRRIRIVCGDYFAFDERSFDAHYDRGALAALPADLRPKYAAHTSSLLTDDAYQLVIVLEYDQAQAAGPPFCVSGDELLAYWPGLERVDRYDDIANCPPKFRDAGLEAMYENVWRSQPSPGH